MNESHPEQHGDLTERGADPDDGSPASRKKRPGDVVPVRRGDPVLRLEKATKIHAPRRGTATFSLAPSSLEIAAGSWTVITGRSGAGKTTLLHLLSGLDWPDDGSVWMFGRNVTNESETVLSEIRRDRLGIVHQQFYFIEYLPVWRNVSCRLVPEGATVTERFERAAQALHKLGLDGMENRLPREMSGGEQQRVALARALINTPDVLIADEPTSNVDAQTGEVILDCLRRLQQSGSTVVVATHDPTLINLADVHYRMENGRLV